MCRRDTEAKALGLHRALALDHCCQFRLSSKNSIDSCAETGNWCFNMRYQACKAAFLTLALEHKQEGGAAAA